MEHPPGGAFRQLVLRRTRGFHRWCCMAGIGGLDTEGKTSPRLGSGTENRGDYVPHNRNNADFAVYPYVIADLVAYVYVMFDQSNCAYVLAELSLQLLCRS